MAHEVVVVGGGIGGLTVAALLSARGIDVCVLERQSQVGGCVARFDKFGYTFEPTMGLYSGWQSGEIHSRIFADLPVEPPETQPLVPGYVVRLAEGSEVLVSHDDSQFEEELRRVFPECAAAAITFYGEVMRVGNVLRQSPAVSQKSRTFSFLPKRRIERELEGLRQQTIAQHLHGTSTRFQSFIELQLRAFLDTKLGDCSYPAACLSLSAGRRGYFEIRGGAAALAERLTESIRRTGGKVRLDTPVLRLSYDSTGNATGVDLLSGENVAASKAIVSNMTVWDTYGKLIGLQRTPPEVKKELAMLQGSGAYLIYAGIDEEVVKRLPADHLIAGSTVQSEVDSTIDLSHFTFASASGWDCRGPANKRAVTISFSSDVEQWFTYQSDPSDHETKDQSALELSWQALHAQVPELGSGIEVIDTVTPATYYDNTRRKLGMVRGLRQSGAVLDSKILSHTTTLSDVFMVGDTISPGASVEQVSHSALALADKIRPTES